MFIYILPVLLASAGLIEARSLLHERHAHIYMKRATDATATTLSADAIQSGSFNDGSDEIGSNEAQQAKSLTSQNNFINNCVGKTLTNGLQITTGSCNGISMGDIPAKTNMVSSMITFPLAGSATIESDTTFNISVQMSNLVTGSFTNADATYYAAPQALQDGLVVGHTHVTIQDMGGSLNPTTALDPTQFAFFKGINDAGNGQGLLQAIVTGGLPAGNYRVCTMASASNHQPVLMPVAQRGTADDCTKFTVIGKGATANAASNNGSGGLAAAALAASAVAAGPDVAESSVASEAVASSSTPCLSTQTIIVDPTSSTKKSVNTAKGAKGAVAETTTSQPAAAATSSSKKGSGKGSKTVVTIIETFFDFSSSLGGLCPSVSKSGNGFTVLEELFDDLASAAAASCGHQFTACVGIAGPGLSLEECTSQKDSCGSAALAATASAAPATVTATVSVPVKFTVTGSIVSSTAVSAATSTTAAGDVAIAQTTASVVLANSIASISSSESDCTISTGIVFVDAPTATIVSSTAPYSNSTVARRRWN